MNAILYGSGRRPKSVSIVAINYWVISRIHCKALSSSRFKFKLISVSQKRIFDGHSRLYSLVPEFFHEIKNEPQSGDKELLSLLAASQLALSFPKKNFKKNLWDQGTVFAVTRTNLTTATSIDCSFYN